MVEADICNQRPFVRSSEEIATSSLAIILPLLNEAPHITPLFAGIRQALGGRPHVICVIDDGSRDGTLELVRAEMKQHGDVHLISRHKRFRGCQRGGALLAGLVWAVAHTDCDLFVEMDGDLSHRPEEMPDGIALVTSGGCDVVIASKYVAGAREVNREWPRRAVSLIGNQVVRTVLTRRIRDFSNGYRFYNRVAAELLSRHRLRWGSPIYLSEALALWLRYRMRVVEFPSVYVGRHEGISKLRWLDLAKALMAIFEIGWRYHVAGFEELPGPEGTEQAAP